MISKCPECGRSYPSHHGTVCKPCVAKQKAKTEAPEPVKPKVAEVVENKPAATKPSVIEPEPDYFPAPVAVAEEKPLFRELDMSLVSSAPQARPSFIEKDKKDGVLELCTNCNTINQNFDLFCTECGTMLFGSATSKTKEYELSQIKAAFPDQIAKLKKVGITNNMQLLDKAYSPNKRKVLSLKAGISEVLLNRLVNQADLLRIDGVEPNEAYLLENIGCNTMKILERKTFQDIVNLIAKNKSALYSRQIIILPEEKRIKKWVEEVKNIEKIVS